MTDSSIAGPTIIESPAGPQKLHLFFDSSKWHTARSYYNLLRKAWGIVNRLPQKDRRKHYSILKSRMNKVKPLL